MVTERPVGNKTVLFEKYNTYPLKHKEKERILRYIKQSNKIIKMIKIKIS